MEKEEFFLPFFGYVYLAGILVAGMALFWYGLRSRIDLFSLITLVIFTILAVSGMALIRSRAPARQPRKDQQVTEKELAEFKENPRMWIYLRALAGLVGMALGAGAAFFICYCMSTGDYHRYQVIHSHIPDFQTYLAFTGLAMIIGFVLFYLLGHFIIFKKQPGNR